jgi:hypothetical protein
MSITSDYRIGGIPAEAFAELRKQSRKELEEQGAVFYCVDEKPGFPCRVTLQDADVGGEVVLINYSHLKGRSPYAGSGPIFINLEATESYNRVGEIPPIFRSRLLSLRGFDSTNMMLEADVVEGSIIENTIARFFSNPDVTFLQAHTARRGCFLAQIDRCGDDR